MPKLLILVVACFCIAMRAEAAYAQDATAAAPDNCGHICGPGFFVSCECDLDYHQIKPPVWYWPDDYYGVHSACYVNPHPVDCGSLAAAGKEYKAAIAAAQRRDVESVLELATSLPDHIVFDSEDPVVSILSCDGRGLMATLSYTPSSATKALVARIEATRSRRLAAAAGLEMLATTQY